MTDSAAPDAAKAAPYAPPAGRVATLDILRGVAVMGILAMNIVAFAMPMQAYFNPLAYGDGAVEDVATWFVNFVFVDGKMRGFFSFLFGASMLLVVERARAAGGSGASIHYRRMFWLLLFGLAHLYLIWWGDILSHYALVGMIAYLFHKLRPSTLIKWAIALLIVEFAFFASGAAYFFVVQAAAAAPGASAEAVAAFQSMSHEFAPLAGPALGQDLALFRGDYPGIVAHRVGAMLFAPLRQLPFFGPETLAYMLLGMAGLKSGFLAGAWDLARYRRTAAITLAIAIPAYALLAIANLATGFRFPELFAISLAGTVPFRPLMVVGYAAIVILLTRRGGALVERIAAAGRAAFTNYLGTSIVMTTIFYGYGLAFYGHVGRPALYLFVLGMWALMLLWSKPWLERFRYGPLEWLWRSLARGRIEPMRKAPA
ncbi:MAG TPA: DUF418 domain-containing protein [Allosphingosinicella sp.]|nr:DUF418 domain-containing protein [Allosphingosinicella sp.]